MESNPIAARFRVAARNLYAMAADLLVNDGRLQADFIVAGREEEIATDAYSNVPTPSNASSIASGSASGATRKSYSSCC